MSLRPEETRAVANCHLHIDHSGNNFRFPRVPIFVQRVERDPASTTLDSSLPDKTIAFPDARFEVLDGEDAEIAPGVRIVPTPPVTPPVIGRSWSRRRRAASSSPVRQAPTRRSTRALHAWTLDRTGSPHPDYAPWVARLQEFDPWRVTFAHDLAIWQREA